MPFAFWSVQKTDTFNRALKKIHAAGYDVAESVQSARWYLQRNPLEVGRKTQDHEVRILPMDVTQGRPGITVFYIVENATVWLLSVRVAEPAQL